MRRLLLTALFAAAPCTGSAQADTSTSSFNVNGLNVILRRNTSNEVVAANVYLLGGTQQLTPATQGIEMFLLNASERGTKHFPGDSIRRAIARLGTRFTTEPSDDWTLVGFTGVGATFDSSWAVLTDRLTAPTLDSAQVELVRAQMIATLRREENDPDQVVKHMADSLSFSGHPYDFAPEGTINTLQSLTLSQLQSYEQSQMVTSRMLVVVVGNIDRAHLEPLVQQTLAQLPHGSYTWSPPHAPARLGRTLATRAAPLPTNYLLGYYPGPSARDPDYQALRIATAVLSGRFFTEIRSRQNLSYEVDAPFVDRALSSGGIYVTTTDPNATLRSMRAELNRLQTELIDPAGLERLVQQFLTDYFLKNETNGDQASFLARAQIYQGDYRAASHFVDDLRRVKPEDVRRVARQYMHDFRFAYVGKPEALSRDLISMF